jgi:hypothetical protein
MLASSGLQETTMRSARHGLFLAALAALGFLAGGAAALAAPVDVDTANPKRWSDLGSSPAEEQRNLKTLSGYLQHAGARHLAPGQTLHVTLVDVDMAGEPVPSRLRAGEDLRVARGGADWPSVTLRWRLSGADGRVVSSGEQVLSDMNYLRRVPTARDNDPLRYEKRLLDDWLKARFGPSRHAGG